MHTVASELNHFVS